MSEVDSRLLEGLQALAADSPSEAPAHVEQRLLVEFRRQSRARLRKRWLAVAGAAIAAGIAVFVWPSAAPPRGVVRIHSPAMAKDVSPVPVQSKPAALPSDHDRGAEVAMNFYRLPDADILPPLDSAVIVRVRLPISSLRLMGVPVNEVRADESVQADVLLGQDGLARGVRFLN